MERIEHPYFTRNFVIVAAIAELFSSFSFWLVDSPIKYPLFVIETISIILVYALLSNYDFRLDLKNIITKRIPAALFLDVLLIYFSAVLIVLNLFNIGGDTSIPRLVLALVSASGLSGFALLNICRLTKYFSKLELLVLSFLTSFILSGLATLALLWADENVRSFVIPSLFILLGFVSFRKHLKFKEVPEVKIKSLSKNIDILAILLCVAFYAITFYYIYPNFTLLADTDISRQYAYSTILSRTPDLFSGFSYFLFNAFGSTLNTLAGSPSMTSILTIQITLSFVLPLSVYVFAKRFLADLDRRIPALAIVFYSILSNFSFIWLTHLKLKGVPAPEIDLLYIVSQKAFNGTIYFLQPFLWFAPSTVAFIMFICAFFLLKVWTIPRSKFILIFAILILSMYFIHVVDPIIFAVILGLYSMVSKTKSLRLDDALIASLIGLVLAAILVAYTSIFWTSALTSPGIKIPTLLPLIAAILLVSISMFWRHRIQSKVHLPVKFLRSKKFYSVLSLGLVALYLYGFVTWFFTNDFKYDFVLDILSVPWFIYPLELGIVGLLAIIAIRYLGYILPNSSVAMLFWSVAISVVIGRMLSFVSLNFTFSGYFEERILWYIFLFFALIAPLPLIKLMDHIQMKKKLIPIIGLSVIISLIIFSGFSSTVSIVEYWYQFTRSLNISQEETDALAHLKNILDHDHRAFTIGTANSSRYVLTLAVTPYNLPTPETFTDSQRPEIALTSLSAHSLDHAYIYLDNVGFNESSHETSWLIEHLLPTLPIVYANDRITIYNATHVSSPRSNSDTHLLIPTDSLALTNSIFYAYDITSLHNSNYTVMFDKDQHALDGKTIVLSFDPPGNNHNTLSNSSLREPSDYISYLRSGGNLIVLNTNGYGPLASLLFHPTNSSYKADTILLPSGDSLPVNLRVMPTASMEQDVTVTGIYSSQQNKSSFFSGEKFVGLGKITYVDIYPIISGFNNNTIDKNVLQKTFDKISGLINLNPVNPASQNIDFKVNFKEMNAEGKITINSSSIIFPDFIDDSKRRDPFLLSHYTFDKTLSITKDSGRLGNDLVRVGSAEIVSDQVGNAINFTGNNYFKASNPSSYNFTTSTPFSIAFWLKMPQVQPSSDPVELAGKTLGDHGKGWHIWSFGDGKIYFTMGNGTTFSEATSTIPIDNNSWQHIVCTYDGSKNQNGMMMYLNGSINSLGLGINDNITYSISNNQILDVGASGDGIHPLNAGTLMADLRIYNSALSDSQVSTLYQVLADKTNPRSTTITIQDNGKEESITDVNTLDIKGYDRAIIRADQIDIADGLGLYGNASLGKSVEVFFKNNAMVTTVSGNNKLSNFVNVSSILIRDNKPIQAYLRQPEINTIGTTSFIQFLGKDFQGNSITARKDISAFGNISLKLLMSDTFSYASDILVKSPVQHTSSGKYQYDEVRSFISSFTKFKFQTNPILVNSLLLIPFIVAAVLILFAKSNNIKQDNEGNKKSLRI